MRNYFDHEKLEVYQVELAFLTWVRPLLTKAKESGVTSRTAEVLDQLDRASLSVLLNTAEGNDRRQRQTRAKFLDDGRGSATEYTACLDALVAKRLCAAEEIDEGKALLLGLFRCFRSWLIGSIKESPRKRELIEPESRTRTSRRATT